MLVINDYILGIYFILIALGIVIAVLSTISGWQKYNNIDNKYTGHLKRLSYKGQWFSGTAGVILTSLTFLLVSLNFYYQHKEFKRGYYQSYQNNFFELIKDYRETAETIQVPRDSFEIDISKSVELKGRLVFGYLYEEYKQEFSSIGIEKDTLTRIKAAYQKFNKTFQPYIGHYFRVVYFLLQDMYDEPNLKNKQFEPFLIKTFRSQISDFEMLLLFYNGLTYEKNKLLFEKYSFLMPINEIEYLLLDINHKKLYKASAFDDNFSKK
ncbi:MAG: hypothetical protein IAE93_07160 [Ignavibacteria bacterium]|nr:hypothetical protein [Ignavibacteria bacterium]